MTVLLNIPYGGSPAGAVVTFPAELEATLVQQRLATASAAALTSGNSTPTGAAIPSIPEIAGTGAAAAGASTFTISNPGITLNSKVQGNIQQATADATATSVVRTSAAAGVATLYFNAATTAQTVVAWAIYN